MLVGLRCDCGGAENMLRSAFYGAKLSNWLEIPIYVGQKASLAYLDTVPEDIKNSTSWKVLYQKISNGGTYAVVFGYDDEKSKWSDVALGDIRSKLEGEVVAKTFER